MNPLSLFTWVAYQETQKLLLFCCISDRVATIDHWGSIEHWVIKCSYLSVTTHAAKST